ncbi:MAG: hypothetical protein WD599_07435 [Balneolaceae bacterium]
MSLQNSSSHQRRYRLTIDFIEKSVQPPGDILDLGSPNPLSERMADKGFNVVNTDFDLDREPERLHRYQADIATAFEILEHLLNPLGVLENLPGERIFASVPIDLWFASAYRNKEDPWDRHFHEFEEWQFDWLLDHAGWTIIRRARWTNPVKKIGIRPFLRIFTPRWYIVEAVRH